MTDNRFKLPYILELDGLRGVAILAVMLFHSKIPFFKGGFIGVDIFFVLSGFLITSLLVQEYDRAGFINLKHFYIRRLLRLGPALGCLLASFVVVSFVFVSQEKASRNYIDVLIALFYLSNWARAFDFHPPDFLGHTWSLSIEEQFYILWPIIFLMLLRAIPARWHIFFVSATLALMSWLLRVFLAMSEVSAQRLYNGLDTRADALMVGCALGVLISSSLVSGQVGDFLSKFLKYIAPIAMLCVLGFSALADWQHSGMYYFGFAAVELLTVILILDVLTNKGSIIGKILAMRWLVWVGSISYGLYLWHYPIYRTMFALGFNCWTVILAGTLVTFIITASSFYFLERRALRFRKFFVCDAPSMSYWKISSAKSFPDADQEATSYDRA